MTPRPFVDPRARSLILLGATFFIVVLTLSPTTCHAQDVTAYADDNTAPSQVAPVYTPQQLDQMLAPIALYPDTLIGPILMASTYPLEIVEAYRWQQNPANAGLQGDRLEEALEQQPWDPSVKSLVASPQILKTLNDNLQWTEQLGDAFLAQQAAVMDSVQHLRQRAETAGTLTSTPQQTVATQGPVIIITPTNPDIVYVPTYNPMIVYGAWPYTGYPPYYFSGYTNYGSAIGFGIGFGVIGALWGWDHSDWGRHHIDIDDRRFGALNRGYAPRSNVWQHDPDHRRGVPYRDTATRARFQANASAETQRNYRGYGSAGSQFNANWQSRSAASTPAFGGYASSPQRNSDTQRTTPREQTVVQRSTQEPLHIARPAPAIAQRPAAPVYESFSRGADVHAQAARGAYSRSTMSAGGNQPHFASAPQQHTAPQRSAPPQGGARSGSGSGGGGHGDNNGRR